MKTIYKASLKKGTRIRVLETGELGTIADKTLIRKDGKVRTYCKIRLDKKPKEDTWYFAEQLGDTKDITTVTFADERGRKLNMIVTQYYDKAPGKNDMNVVLGTEDGGNLLEHEGGLHFCLAAMLLKALCGTD